MHMDASGKTGQNANSKILQKVAISCSAAFWEWLEKENR